MLATARTVIVDEIHALVRDKRGATWRCRSSGWRRSRAGRCSASASRRRRSRSTRSARFLVGAGRECALVDAGSFRELDLAVEVPPSPLATVCSHEQWDGDLRAPGRAGRASTARRSSSSTRARWPSGSRRSSRSCSARRRSRATTAASSRERRLDAEQRLKAGSLRALVATASLELGIDIGDVDLVLQVGATRSIATLLQRVGRAGHALARVPKGRLFPLTLDELVEAAALLRCVRERAPRPHRRRRRARSTSSPSRSWRRAWPRPGTRSALFETLRRAWPYRDLTRDGVRRGRARCTPRRPARAAPPRRRRAAGCAATRRARLTALTVRRRHPRHRRLPGAARARGDARRHRQRGLGDRDRTAATSSSSATPPGASCASSPASCAWPTPRASRPSLPFWLGEGPGPHARALGRDRATCASERAADGAEDPVAFLLRELRRRARRRPRRARSPSTSTPGARALGCVPTQRRVVLERFFDESGGMQLVVHAPFGSRINRAWGLALRKRFCVGFGFELQAAANEEAIVLSPRAAAQLPARGGLRLPAPADRARRAGAGAARRADVRDALALERPARRCCSSARATARGCRPPLAAHAGRGPPGRGLPPGARLPRDAARRPDRGARRPPDRAPDRRGLPDRGHGRGRLPRGAARACATADRAARRSTRPSRRPSRAASSSSQPYTLPRRRAARGAAHPGGDDAAHPRRPHRRRAGRARPRRRRARARGGVAAARRTPRRSTRRCSGWATSRVEEARTWRGWLDELARGGPRRARGRSLVRGRGAARSEGRAARPARGARARLRRAGLGRRARCCSQLEAEGVVLRTRIDGRAGLVRPAAARPHPALHARPPAPRDRARDRGPVPALPRLLAARRPGAPARRPARAWPRSCAQLAGFEVPAAAWEASVLPARVRGYKREWLDQLDARRARWPGGGSGAPRRQSPVRRDADRPRAARRAATAWLALAASLGAAPEPAGTAREVEAALAARGAVFVQEIARRRARSRRPTVEDGPGRARRPQGRVTCDSFGGLRWLLRARLAPRGAPGSPAAAGACSSAGRRAPRRRSARRVRGAPAPAPHRRRVPPDARARAHAGAVARRGPRLPHARGARRDPGRPLRRRLRRRAVRAPRGGHAAPRRPQARRAHSAPASVSAADPLNFRGILTPDERISPATRRLVEVG